MMLKCSTSLWSADLANLESEIKRVEPFSERFHLDVADGHFTPTLLFFPDLVKAMRSHTEVPMEVHLMATDPLAWVEPFAEAGVNGVIFCYDSLVNVGEAIDVVHQQGLFAGISLDLGQDVELLDPYWNELELVTLIGTAVGIKVVLICKSRGAENKKKMIFCSTSPSGGNQVDGLPPTASGHPSPLLRK